MVSRSDTGHKSPLPVVQPWRSSDNPQRNALLPYQAGTNMAVKYVPRSAQYRLCHEFAPGDQKVWFKIYESGHWC